MFSFKLFWVVLGLVFILYLDYNFNIVKMPENYKLIFFVKFGVNRIILRAIIKGIHREIY
jgi:hypothetical protein